LFLEEILVVSELKRTHMGRPPIKLDLVPTFRGPRVLTLAQLLGRLACSRSTALRRLSEHGYYSSYNHAGKFLTIDEVAVYQHPLSPLAVAEHYAAGQSIDELTAIDQAQDARQFAKLSYDDHNDRVSTLTDSTVHGEPSSRISVARAPMRPPSSSSSSISLTTRGRSLAHGCGWLTLSSATSIRRPSSPRNKTTS